MKTRLYLDTARMGLPALSVRKAQEDFFRLMSEEGLSGCLDELLSGGFDAWPESLGRRYRGLRDWRGVRELKESLRRLLLAPPETRVFLASRSSALMKLTARAFFLQCRRVLVTDLTWPGYAKLLERERTRIGRKVETLSVRSKILDDRASAGEIARLIARYFRDRRCDGIFLPAVSHEGIRLPLGEILSLLKEAGRPRFFAVDGAQALSHVPVDLTSGAFDLFLAGSHKWLRGVGPMGMGFCPRANTRCFIWEVAQRMIDSGELDDPLLRFTEELESKERDTFSETVNISPLFSARAAARLAEERGSGGEVQFRRRQIARDALEGVSKSSGWKPLLPQSPLRSGILLLQATGERIREALPEGTRRLFQAFGISITAYEGALVRFSMPTGFGNRGELDFIRDALRRVGRSRV